MIEPYLRDMINDHKAIGEWKIQLAIQTNFISSIDSGKFLLWAHGVITKIIMGSKTDDIINELTDSLLEDYQEGFQSMDKSEFAFDSVDLLYYHLHKISLKRGKSYIKSPEWLENKRATINLKNDDDSCFQYAVELNYNKFKKRDLRRILNTIQYDRKDIYFSSHLEDWEKFEQSKSQLLLISYLHHTIVKK